MTAKAAQNGRPVTPEEFGRTVLGPVVAEFCQRLWAFASFLDRPEDTALLFCARGGLRLQLAYERFCARTGRPSPAVVRPLMVSRVAAVRPSLVRAMDGARDDLLPAASAALSFEFSQVTLGSAAVALAGVSPTSDRARFETPFAPSTFMRLLRDPAGRGVAEALREQAALFERHLRDMLGGRAHAALVDTGLYGTTRQVLAEGVPDLWVSSPLVARSFRPGSEHPAAFGLCVEATCYEPWRRRTVLLRYWQFVEWLFEPQLPSVRTFHMDSGTVHSNLETPGWQRRVEPEPGTAFAGVMAYLDELSEDGGEQLVADADRAWSELRRAIVWPHRQDAAVLAVGQRSHDFGLEGTWTARPWQSPIRTLRGSSMWREGEAALSGPYRWPLLAGIEVAHGTRALVRLASARVRRASDRSRMATDGASTEASS